MTRIMLAVALTVTPSPITAPKEAPQWPPIATASIAAPSPPISSIESMIIYDLASDPVSYAPIEQPALTAESPPPEPPPPPLTPMELVDQHFGWPGAQLVQCESNWNRWAVGRYGERGLFQIHPVHRYGIVARLGYSWDDMFEVLPNILVAVEIRYAQGLRAWTCWRG